MKGSALPGVVRRASEGSSGPTKAGPGELVLEPLDEADIAMLGTLLASTSCANF